MNALEKMIVSAKRPFDYKAYKSTNVIKNTNALSHMLGITTVPDTSLLRLGAISGLKPVLEEYADEKEVRNLFVADAETLGLSINEISFSNNIDLISKVTQLNLQDNQHVAILFVRKFANEKISSFDGIRFDKEAGWTKKSYRKYLTRIENVVRDWPIFWTETVGAYILTR